METCYVLVWEWNSWGQGVWCVWGLGRGGCNLSTSWGSWGGATTSSVPTAILSHVYPDQIYSAFSNIVNGGNSSSSSHGGGLHSGVNSSSSDSRADGSLPRGADGVLNMAASDSKKSCESVRTNFEAATRAGEVVGEEDEEEREEGSSSSSKEDLVDKPSNRNKGYEATTNKPPPSLMEHQHFHGSPSGVSLKEELTKDRSADRAASSSSSSAGKSSAGPEKIMSQERSTSASGTARSSETRERTGREHFYPPYHVLHAAAGATSTMPPAGVHGAAVDFRHRYGYGQPYSGNIMEPTSYFHNGGTNGGCPPPMVVGYPTTLSQQHPDFDPTLTSWEQQRRCGGSHPTVFAPTLPSSPTSGAPRAGTTRAIYIVPDPRSVPGGDPSLRGSGEDHAYRLPFRDSVISTNVTVGRRGNKETTRRGSPSLGRGNHRAGLTTSTSEDHRDLLRGGGRSGPDRDKSSPCQRSFRDWLLAVLVCIPPYNRCWPRRNNSKNNDRPDSKSSVNTSASSSSGENGAVDNHADEDRGGRVRAAGSRWDEETLLVVAKLLQVLVCGLLVFLLYVGFFARGGPGGVSSWWGGPTPNGSSYWYGATPGVPAPGAVSDGVVWAGGVVDPAGTTSAATSQPQGGGPLVTPSSNKRHLRRQKADDFTSEHDKEYEKAASMEAAGKEDGESENPPKPLMVEPMPEDDSASSMETGGEDGIAGRVGAHPQDGIAGRVNAASVGATGGVDASSVGTTGVGASMGAPLDRASTSVQAGSLPTLAPAPADSSYAAGAGAAGVPPVAPSNANVAVAPTPNPPVAPTVADTQWREYATPPSPQVPISTVLAAPIPSGGEVPSISGVEVVPSSAAVGAEPAKVDQSHRRLSRADDLEIPPAPAKQEDPAEEPARRRSVTDLVVRENEDQQDDAGHDRRHSVEDAQEHRPPPRRKERASASFDEEEDSPSEPFGEREEGPRPSSEPFEEDADRPSRSKRKGPSSRHAQAKRRLPARGRMKKAQAKRLLPDILPGSRSSSSKTKRSSSSAKRSSSSSSKTHHRDRKSGTTSNKRKKQRGSPPRPRRFSARPRRPSRKGHEDHRLHASASIEETGESSITATEDEDGDASSSSVAVHESASSAPRRPAPSSEEEE